MRRPSRAAPSAAPRLPCARSTSACCAAPGRCAVCSPWTRRSGSRGRARPAPGDPDRADRGAGVRRRAPRRGRRRISSLLAAHVRRRAPCSRWVFEVAGRRAASTVLSELRLALVERGCGTSRWLSTEPARGRSRPRPCRASTVSRRTSPATCRRSCWRCVVPLAVLALARRRSIRSRPALMLLTLPLVPVFMWLVGRYTEERTRERWHALRLLSTHFLDVVRGLPTLRAFNRARHQAASVAERRRALPPRDDGDPSRRLPLRLGARAGRDARRGSGRRHGRRAARRRRPRARRPG